MAQINCLDTYALIEITLGNKKFEKFTKQDFVITDITLAEFYGVLLRNEGDTVANYWYKNLESYSVSTGKEVFISAIRFRQEHRKKKISFFDAVGYVYATTHDMKFVTGDKAFEDFDSVVFEKKISAL